MTPASDGRSLVRKIFNGNLSLAITVVFTAGVLFTQIRFMAVAQNKAALAQEVTANQITNLTIEMAAMKVILDGNQRQAAKNEMRLVEISALTATNTQDIIRLMERTVAKR